MFFPVTWIVPLFSQLFTLLLPSPNAAPIIPPVAEYSLVIFPWFIQPVIIMSLYEEPIIPPINVSNTSFIYPLLLTLP